MPLMISQDEDAAGDDRQLSMVDEALVAGTIANTNGLLVILAKLVAKGVFDEDDLKAFSDSYANAGPDGVYPRRADALFAGAELGSEFRAS